MVASASTIRSRGAARGGRRRRALRKAGTRGVPRATRERQMLEVAGRLFAERGYYAVSVHEIAEQAGVSKPMVYAYFASKEGLYVAYIERAGGRLLEALRGAASAELAPEERLWAGLVAFFEFVDEHREGWAVLFSEAAARGGPSAAGVAQVRQEIVSIVRSVLAEVSDAPEHEALETAEPLAHALVGAGESLANWWLAHPEESTEAVALRLMSLVWSGAPALLAGRSPSPQHEETA